MTPLKIPREWHFPKISRRTAAGLIVFAVCVVLSLVLLGIRTHLIESQTDLRGAARFAPGEAYTQISCYFAPGMPIERMREFYYKIESGLVTNAIEQEADNPDARLFLTAYCTAGTVSLTRETRTASAEAIGTGGDFFQMHPVELISGMYYLPEALSRDQILIDETLAWQLFGGTDIAGQPVQIGTDTFFVCGVCKTGEGRFREAAGNAGALVYLPAEALAASGMVEDSERPVYCFETVLPDPVKGFASDLVSKQLGFDETQMQLTDHRVRFSPRNLFRVITSFGTRSMAGAAFTYPFWENLARGTEDILACILAVQALLILTAVLLFVWAAVWLYRHKKWTAGGLIGKAGDRIYESQAKRRRAKQHATQVLEEVHL